jgi:hypothetical protein
MMQTICPSGHTSSASDYCDQCGARLMAAAPEPTAPHEVVARDPEPCPRCGTMKIDDDAFCENCGYRFGSDESTIVTWEVVVDADRRQFDRVEPEGVTFPTSTVLRTVPLSEAEIRIGRGADNAIACDDPAVSHAHAVLVRQHDGCYAVRDVGSTNGTRINDDPTPLLPEVLVSLANGDCVRVGAWTTVTIREAIVHGSS